MSKTTSTFAAVCLASWMLAPTARGEEQKPKLAKGCTGCDQAAQQPAGDGNGYETGSVQSNCICLAYPYAFYATHWSYYALDCRTVGPTPISYDAPPGSAISFYACTATSCAPMGCIGAPPPRAPAPYPSNAAKSDAGDWVKQDGLDYPLTPDFRPFLRGTTLPENEIPITLVTVELPQEYVSKSTKPIYAAVFEVTVDPPDPPGKEYLPATFRTGIEVTRPSKPPQKKAANVKPNWPSDRGNHTRCIWMTVEGLEKGGPFQVILEKDLYRPAKPRERPAPRRKRTPRKAAGRE